MDSSKTPAPAVTDAISAVVALIEQAMRSLANGDPLQARALLDRAHAIADAARCKPDAGSATLSQSPRIQVRTLGAFSVTIDGHPIKTGRKQPRRPLELLKALIVFGGHQVPQATLADVLWPEYDGDHAHNALTAALHRLRYLLRVPGALVVCEGRVSLDPQRICVDAFDADVLMRDLQSTGIARHGSLDALFALYHGPFLPDDTGIPWTDRLRERLRQRFSACVGSAAATLERAGRLTDAHALYRRAAVIDDCAPRLHDGMLRCAEQIDAGLLSARSLSAFAGLASSGATARAD